MPRYHSRRFDRDTLILDEEGFPVSSEDNPLGVFRLDTNVVRHNAYVMGFMDGASDDYSTKDYRIGKRIGGVDYLDGFKAGCSARSAAFAEAKKRKEGVS